MLRRAAGVALCAALLGGCGLWSSNEEDPAPTPRLRATDPGAGGAPPLGAGARDSEVIRGWITALNDGRFDRAARFFARGAVVQQLIEERLETREEAIEFNRSLPCRADLTDVKDEGETALAAFRLRPGRGGRCPEGGIARVRFRIVDGRFREWRQLAEPAAPQGDAT